MYKHFALAQYKFEVLNHGFRTLPENKDRSLEVKQQLTSDCHVLEQHLHYFLLEEVIWGVDKHFDKHIEEFDLQTLQASLLGQ